MAQPLWKTASHFPVKLNIYLAYVLETLLLGICSREIKIDVHTRIHILFITDPLIIFKNWKQSKYASIGESINYSTSIHYYSAIKRNKILIHTTIWMNLKDMKPCEGDQFQRVTCYMIPFVKHLGKGKIMVTENRSVVAKGWELGVTTEGHENFGGLWNCSKFSL